MAFLTEQGGKESHAAILARAMEIPAVLGMEGLLSRIARGNFLIVDGNMGLVVLNPPEEVIQEYRQAQEKIQAHRRNLEVLVSSACETRDGQRLKLMANIGNMVDLEFALQYRADGIGLFRTEIPFLMAERFLSEEEQLDMYRTVVEKMSPREVTIRTLDLGGDTFLKIPHPEKNPFWGYRSIRFFFEGKMPFADPIKGHLEGRPAWKSQNSFPHGLQHRGSENPGRAGQGNGKGAIGSKGRYWERHSPRCHGRSSFPRHHGPEINEGDRFREHRDE